MTSLDYNYQGIVLQDFIQIINNGETVASLDARFSFKDVPQEYQAQVLQSIQYHLNGLRLSVLSQEQLEKSDKIMKIFEERKREYKNFPWYKRIFKRIPTVSEISDEYEEYT